MSDRPPGLRFTPEEIARAAANARHTDRIIAVIIAVLFLSMLLWAGTNGFGTGGPPTDQDEPYMCPGAGGSPYPC